MKVTISGYGGGTVAPHEIDWPFDFPPQTGMQVQWKDPSGNDRRGVVDTMVLDITRGRVAITVSIR